MDELAFPAAVAPQLGRCLFERLGENRAEEPVRRLADRLAPRPAVELLRAPVPVGNFVAHVADENGVVGQVKESGLLTQNHFCPLAVFDVGIGRIPFRDLPGGLE